MKEKKMYSAPKMERLNLEVEAPIATSYGGGGGAIAPQGGGVPSTYNP